MTIGAWVILLAWSALVATVAQYAFFRSDRKPNDYDWVYLAGGALLGGFTANVWYPGFGPVVVGLYALQGLAGGVVGAAVVEVAYRLFIRPRQRAASTAPHN